MSRRNPFSRPIDYEGVGVDLMWYLRPEATREARWRALSGTGLDVLAVVCDIRPLEERAELARLRARLARHRRNREIYGRHER